MTFSGTSLAEHWTDWRARPGMVRTGRKPRESHKLVGYLRFALGNRSSE